MKVPEKILEQVLILRFQTGDTSAFDGLVERYHSQLGYFVRRLLGSLDNADDVLQNVWVTAYKKLPSLNAPEAFSLWLYRIARHKALQELRKNKKYVPIKDEDLPATETEEEQEELEVGLESLADKHGLDKLLDTIARMSKKDS